MPNTSNVTAISGGQGGEGGQVAFGGGAGGGMVGIPMKEYVDAQDEKTRAQNDARFAEVISKLDAFTTGVTWPQMLGVSIVTVVTGLGLVFAILAYASDRFDSGVAAMGAIEEALDNQREMNADQDQRIDRLLTVIEEQNDQPETSSTE